MLVFVHLRNSLEVTSCLYILYKINVDNNKQQHGHITTLVYKILPRIQQKSSKGYKVYYISNHCSQC